MMGPDRGDRYLESLYDGDWLASNEFTLTDPAELEGDILATLQPVTSFPGDPTQ